MPKIPLYNQGKGSSIETYTGSLSPMARASAFTSVGKAQAAFFDTASRIASDFAAKESADQVNREYSKYVKEFADKELEFTLNDKSTETTTYQQSYDTFSTNFLNGLRSRNDLSERQKEIIEQKLQPAITARRVTGSKTAFDRGIDDRRVADNEAVASYVNQMSTLAVGSAEYTRINNEAETLINSAIADRIPIDYTIQSFRQGVKVQDLGVRSNAGASIADWDALRQEVDADETIPFKAKEQLKAQFKQDETNYRNNLYDQVEQFIVSSDFDYRQGEAAKEVLDQGGVITFMQNGVERSLSTQDLTARQRRTLVGVINGEQKDLEDLETQNLSGDLAEADDPFQASIDLFKAENRGKYQGTDLQLENIILGQAQDIAQSVKAQIASGEITDVQSMLDDLSSAESMINHDYRGAGSFLTRTGRQAVIGNTANTIQQTIAAARKDIRKAVASKNTTSALTNSLLDGSFVTVKNALDPKDGEANKAIDNVLTGLGTEGQLFNDNQINVAAQNNVTWSTWKDTLGVAAARIKNPDVNVAEDPYIMQSIELYRAMDLREGMKANHTTPETRALFESIQTLEKAVGIEAAIQTVRFRPDDINVEQSYKLIKKKVEEFVDENSQTYSWFDYIPFLGSDSEFVPTNLAQIQNDIASSSKELIRNGLGAEQALEAAATMYGETHVRVRNIVIPKTTDLPTNIEDLATSAINYISNTEVAAEGMGGSYASREDAVRAGIVPTADSKLAADIADGIIDVNELSIQPIAGQTTQWMLVENNIMPISGEKGVIKFTLEQLEAIHDAQAALQKEESRAELNLKTKLNSDYETNSGLFEGLTPYQKSRKLAELEGRSFSITWEDVKNLLGTKKQRQEKMNKALENWANQ